MFQAAAYFLSAASGRKTLPEIKSFVKARKGLDFVEDLGFDRKIRFRMGQFGFQLLHSALSHLPFMVVSAVTWCGTRLLFAAHVQAKIVYFVMIVMTISMIDQFLRGQRSSEMLRHYPTMFRNSTSFSSHLIEHRQIIIADCIFPQLYVAVLLAYAAAQWVSSCSEITRLWQLSVTLAARSFVVWMCRLISQCTNRNPTTNLAVRTSNQRCWSYMSADQHALNV